MDENPNPLLDCDFVLFYLFRCSNHHRGNSTCAHQRHFFPQDETKCQNYINTLRKILQLSCWFLEISRLRLVKRWVSRGDCVEANILWRAAGQHAKEERPPFMQPLQLYSLLPPCLEPYCFACTAYVPSTSKREAVGNENLPSEADNPLR
jgi:hypothetical protein